VSSLTLLSTTPQVFVVTSEGILYVYHIDFETGGECVLQKSHKCVRTLGLAALSLCSLMDGFDDISSQTD